MDRFERAEQCLENERASGAISDQEYNAEIRELQRDYRAAAEERAQDAYDVEIDNW